MSRKHLRALASRKDTPRTAVALLTALFLATALWSLGSTAFPSSGWQASGEVVLDLGAVRRVDRVAFAVLDHLPLRAEIACGAPASWDDRTVAASQGNYRHWTSASPGCDTRYLRLNFSDSQATVGEVALFRGSEPLAVADVRGPPGSEALADEPGVLTEPPNFLHGSYFDEIYFMRTADEYLRRAPPFFEWTHPPLGKDLIAIGILVAGNGPFGWRFLGVLAGAAAIPVAYLLGRRLLRTARAGVVTAALLTFDFMHFTQARISTGEIFLFLFLTAMWAAFAKWWAMPPEEPMKSTSTKGSENIERTSATADSAHMRRAPSEARGEAVARARAIGTFGDPLFLAVVFFGLALSVKVVAVNSLVGLLLLGLLRIRRERELFRPAAKAFVAGLAVAGALYLASYAPYYASGLGLGDVLAEQCCGPRSIFAYHAALEAGHPYGSPWWSWPLMLHPLWLHGQTLADGRVSTIVSMGNPALWWVGLVFVVLALARARQDRAALFIGGAWLVQWLAFAPITRVLFLYHYMPNVAFLALACAWGVERTGERDPRRGLWLAAGLVAASAILFAVFYPVLSGAPVDSAYKEALRWIRFGFPLWWGKNHGQPASWDF